MCFHAIWLSKTISPPKMTSYDKQDWNTKSARKFKKSMRVWQKTCLQIINPETKSLLSTKTAFKSCAHLLSLWNYLCSKWREKRNLGAILHGAPTQKKSSFFATFQRDIRTLLYSCCGDFVDLLSKWKTFISLWILIFLLQSLCDIL